MKGLGDIRIDDQTLGSPRYIVATNYRGAQASNSRGTVALTTAGGGPRNTQLFHPITQGIGVELEFL